MWNKPLWFIWERFDIQFFKKKTSFLRTILKNSFELFSKIKFEIEKIAPFLLFL